jgi:hypothetical protein
MPSSIKFPDLACNAIKINSDFSESFFSEKITFQPEVGQTRVRKKYKISPRLFDVSLNLNTDQYEIFYNFYYNVIKQGIYKFDIELVDGDENFPVFFTVRILDEFTSEVSKQQEYKISFKLYSIEESFSVRPLITNVLILSSENEFSGSINLQIPYEFRLDSEISFSGEIILGSDLILNGTIEIEGSILFEASEICCEIVDGGIW